MALFREVQGLALMDNVMNLTAMRMRGCEDGQQPKVGRAQKKTRLAIPRLLATTDRVSNHLQQPLDLLTPMFSLHGKWLYGILRHDLLVQDIV